MKNEGDIMSLEQENTGKDIKELNDTDLDAISGGVCGGGVTKLVTSDGKEDEILHGSKELSDSELDSIAGGEGSSGGIIKLITTDGKQDELLLGEEELMKRLEEIEEKRNS